ncbi:MAG: hypothetical protein JXR10_06875 [Cyclobacteriaceae bacterium]
MNYVFPVLQSNHHISGLYRMTMALIGVKIYSDENQDDTKTDEVYLEIAFQMICVKFLIKVGHLKRDDAIKWRSIKLMLIRADLIAEREFAWARIHEFRKDLIEGIPKVFNTKRLQWTYFGILLDSGNYVVPLRLLHKWFPMEKSRLIKIGNKQKEACVTIVKSASQLVALVHQERRILKSVLTWFEFPTEDFHFNLSFSSKSFDRLDFFEISNSESGFRIEWFKIDKYKNVNNRKTLYEYKIRQTTPDVSEALSPFLHAAKCVIEEHRQALDFKYSVEMIIGKPD